MFHNSKVMAAAAAFALAAPAQAAVVFQDNFDREQDGQPLTNFEVIGAVSVLLNSGNICGAASLSRCLDLTGTVALLEQGNVIQNVSGEIISRSSFSFSAGDEVKLEFLAGRILSGVMFDFEGAAFARFLFDGITSFENVSFSGPLFTTLTEVRSFIEAGLFNDSFFTSSPHSISFTARSPGSLRLSFQSLSTTPGVFIIDDIALSITPPAPAIPEPASWAMMIAGFGLAGGAMRAQRRASGSRIPPLPG